MNKAEHYRKRLEAEFPCVITHRDEIVPIAAEEFAARSFYDDRNLAPFYWSIEWVIYEMLEDHNRKVYEDETGKKLSRNLSESVPEAYHVWRMKNRTELWEDFKAVHGLRSIVALGADHYAHISKARLRKVLTGFYKWKLKHEFGDLAHSEYIIPIAAAEFANNQFYDSRNISPFYREVEIDISGEFAAFCRESYESEMHVALDPDMPIEEFKKYAEWKIENYDALWERFTKENDLKAYIGSGISSWAPGRVLG